MKLRRVAALACMSLMASCSTSSPHPSPTPPPHRTPPTPTPTEPPSTIAQRCARRVQGVTVLRGDFDGDGRTDIAYSWYGFAASDATEMAPRDNDLRIGVCTGAGARDEYDAGGVGMLTDIIDINRDGRKVLGISGEYNVGSEYLGFYVVRDGRVRPVTTGGVPASKQGPYGFFVVAGFVVGGVPTPRENDDWGCLDVPGERRREVFSDTSTFPAGRGHGRWKRSIFSFDGATMTLVKTDSGDAGTDVYHPTTPQAGVSQCDLHQS